MAARWIAPNQVSKHRIENDIGPIVSQEPTINLMQNCDLPPPLKLFSRPDHMFLTSMSKIHGIGGQQEADKDNQKLFHMHKDCTANDKLELFKALRLSQTRAREADRKLAVLNKEKDSLSNMLLQDSLRLFAHHQWITLLELQVFKLQRQEKGRQRNYAAPRSPEDSDFDSANNKWGGTAIAVILAVTGMGFAFGCAYFS